MTTADARPFEFVSLDIDEIRTLVAPGLPGAEVIAAERVDGGLVNSIYRVVPSSGEPLGLRIYAAGRQAFDREQGILSRAPQSIPVPRLRLAVAESPVFPHPYVVYSWVEGITLNQCRRETSGAGLSPLAQSLGRLAASVATWSPELAHPSRTVGASLAEADARLGRGRARERLGSVLADSLRARLAAMAPRLEAADRVRGPVHGDFGGRNIIVTSSDDGTWRVNGLLDWEYAFAGASLWDVGSFFRYFRRYSREFRSAFEAGYVRASGWLPDGWYFMARLLDATRLVGILGSDRELPIVFTECRDLIEALVQSEEVS